MTPAASSRRIRRNLDAVMTQIQSATDRACRSRNSVLLVGVTKLATIEDTLALLEAGCHVFGENRPEELAQKAMVPELGRAVWHMIGTYQRRKIRDTLVSVSMVQSIDSWPLAQAISRRAVELGKQIPSLIQVNVSGEPTKHGLSPSEIKDEFARYLDLPGLRVEGLMTMAPAGAPEARLHSIFGACRELRDTLASPAHPLPHLSMGMSSDFVPAILEGATLVRIGSALFAPD